MMTARSQAEKGNEKPSTVRSLGMVSIHNLPIEAGSPTKATRLLDAHGIDIRLGLSCTLHNRLLILRMSSMP